MEFSLNGRKTALATMQSQTLDLLVIGGGITGSGIALDAQSRGLDTGSLKCKTLRQVRQAVQRNLFTVVYVI